LYFIHNTPFSSEFTNRPNKLDRYTTLDWKGLPVTNTLSYRGPICKLRRKRSVVNATPGLYQFFTLSSGVRSIPARPRSTSRSGVNVIKLSHFITDASVKYAQVFFTVEPS
jgi:hypothetical protein